MWKNQICICFCIRRITSQHTAYMEVPLVDEDKCTYCGACSDLCQYKAITVLAEVILTFPEMCHGCGGCRAVCPEDAISWTQRELGQVSQGRVDEHGFLMGRLRVGEAMSPPLMRQVLGAFEDEPGSAERDVIIDCPPGVSCPAVTAVMQSDLILLVTEPTPFGMYDFKLAYEAFTPLGKPMAAVINRAGLGDEELEAYCQEHDIPILARIPFDREAAKAYANGDLVSQASEELRQTFSDLTESLRAWGRAELEASHA